MAKPNNKETRQHTREFVETLMKLPAADRSRLMCREKLRLHTYGSLWPIPDQVSPEALARAGFYYTGIADRVQCAICRGVLRNWEGGDVAWNEHQKHFSFCRLIKGQDASNIPLSMDNGPLLGVEDLQRMVDASVSSGRHGSLGHANRPFSGYMSVSAFGGFSRPIIGLGGFASTGSNELESGYGSGISDAKSMDLDWNSGGVDETSARLGSGSIEEPKYADFAIRMKTFDASLDGASPFRGWTGGVRPIDMAKAGFYMTGSLDEVQCFDCGLHLSHWEAGDDPLKEHLKFSRSCSFATQMFTAEGKDAPNSSQSFSCDFNEIEPKRLPQAVMKTGESAEASLSMMPAVKVNSTNVPQFLCPDCKQGNADTVSLPCGHVDLCQRCAESRLLSAGGPAASKRTPAGLGDCSRCALAVRKWAGVDSFKAVSAKG